MYLTKLQCPYFFPDRTHAGFQASSLPYLRRLQVWVYPLVIFPKLGLLGSALSRASLVLPPPRAEYLVRAQAVHRCRGLPCGAGEEIVWRSRGIAYTCIVVLVEIWYSLLLVECSTTGTLSVVQAPARLNANSSRKWRW